MANVLLALVSDRHADIEVEPFSKLSDAIKYALDAIPSFYRESTLANQTLTESAISDGWLLNVAYSGEGEFVRVIRRTVDREVS